MKILAKIDKTNKIHLPADIMAKLNVKAGDELIWDLTDVLTNDLEKDSYVAATLSKLDDYEHEEKFRNRGQG